MRIIGGEYKRKKLFEPKDKLTRPLKDLTKESIFNLIQHSNKFEINFLNSKILDLFSGVGSFGLEAISRGSRNVTFVENYSGVLDLLKKNISSINAQNYCKIIENDVFLSLENVNLNDAYDIIFLDPPYKEKKLLSIFDKIYSKKIIKKNGIIIVHRHKKEKDEFPKNFNIIEERVYGISKIIFGNYL